jgi:uncharacterized protein YukE
VAEKFDAPGRLAEGQPAVDDMQALVWASRSVGYQNPNLTGHAAQVREWYASEDGLNLRVLDADSAAFGRAMAATQEALARQDEQRASLAAAWQGDGAHASFEFLQRHSTASSTVAAAVRTAAETLAGLRDELWRLIDAKAAAAVAVGERVGAQRAAWLAAAETVMSGSGDRAQASELIDQQVKPFVDNTIGGEWLTVMRSTEQSVAAAYEAATDELSAGRDAVFDVPNGLGPVWVPAAGDAAAPTAPAAASVPQAVATTPSAWSAPPSWGAPSSSGTPPSWGAPPSAMPMGAVSPPVDPLPAPAAPEPAASAPALPSAPSLGGLSDVGGGLSGFGQQLADMLGGLIGSGEGLSEPPDLDDPPELDDVNDPSDADERDDDAESDDESGDVPVDPAGDTEEVGEDTDNACPTEPSVAPDPAEPPADLAEAAPTAVPPPPPTPPEPPEPLLEPEPQSAAAPGTPCEIAADKLPQVGE